jgi:exodeoxyribonuclease VII large subunit
VADLRVPTPSAAAEMTIPDKNNLINNLSLLKSKITRAVKRNFELKTENINSIGRSLKYQRPENKINQYYQYIDEFSARLNSKIKHKVELYEERIKKDSQRLDSLSPWAIIERGYSICRKIPGREIIKRLNQIEVGSKIEVIVSDGKILSKVEEKEAVSN